MTNTNLEVGNWINCINSTQVNVLFDHAQRSFCCSLTKKTVEHTYKDLNEAVTIKALFNQKVSP